MSEQSVWARSIRARLSRRRLMQGGAALAGLGLSGCVGGNQINAPASLNPTAAAAAVGTAAPAAVKPKYGGTLRTSANTAGTHDDIQLGAGASSSLNTVLAYSGLMQFKYGKGVQPTAYQPTGDLAESWEQPDDLTYIFKLRQGVKFQNIKPVNGRELTSADILYSYQRIIDLKALAAYLNGVQKMEAPDPYTFKITLSEPNADFLVNLSAPSLVVVAKEAVEINGDLKKGPIVGSGAWIVESIDPSTRAMAMVRNPDYFRKGLPYADRLEIQRIVDASTFIAAFRGKELDTIASGVLPQQSEPLRKANPNEVNSLDVILYLASDEFGFKSDVPPFNDARVRKAVIKAIDRETLIAAANGGFAILTSGVVTPDVSWQLTPDILKSLYKRDVVGAKQLLGEAGVPNLQFELTVPTFKAQVYVTMGEQIQAQLREAGIDMKLRVLDPLAYTGTVSTRGEFSAYLSNAGGRITANQDLLGRFHSRGAMTRIQTKYSNPQLDALIDQQRVLSRDPAKRRTLLDQIQRTVIEDDVIVSMSASIQPILSWSYVKDFDIGTNIVDSYGVWTEAWLDK
jgi:peptide/nickel transport system substrate-binding protein